MLDLIFPKGHPLTNALNTDQVKRDLKDLQKVQALIHTNSPEIQILTTLHGYLINLADKLNLDPEEVKQNIYVWLIDKGWAYSQGSCRNWQAYRYGVYTFKERPENELWKEFYQQYAKEKLVRDRWGIHSDFKKINKGYYIYSPYLGEMD